VPTDPQAAEYRRRAAALRQLAARLDDTPLLTLHRWAGEDTWSSPRVEACRTQLGIDQARIRAAADELRGHAWRFERQAEVLDAAAALATIAAPAR